jgi:transcriptional regulator with XRE-family HTH domain
VVKNDIREAVVCEVIRRLGEARKQKGLSMNQIAERSGLSQSMVSLVERNMRNPTLDTLLRIGEALELDVGEIITSAHKTVRKRSRDL